MYLTAAVVHSLIQPLPSGTAFCIGVVLLVMMTGRLVQTKGSLARAVLPCVVHLRWGWHRVERAMERGTFSLDAMFDRASAWCLAHLPLDPVRLGREHREVNAIDSSTIAVCGRARAWPWRAQATAIGLAGPCGPISWPPWASVVMIHGVRVGLVRRTRFRTSCQDAVARVWRSPPTRGNGSWWSMRALPPRSSLPRRPSQTPLLGRLRINAKLRCAPPPPTGNPGRRPLHGEVIHAGRDVPRWPPDVERHIPGEAGLIRLRRWYLLHDEACPTLRLDVVRIDDPTYDTPLLVGTTAYELTSGVLGRLPASVAGGDELLCGPRYHRHGEAAGVDGNGAGAADQFGLVGRIAVESPRSGLCAAGDGPVGSPAYAFGRSPGELSRSPFTAFCGLPRRSRTENYRKNPKGLQSKDLRRRTAA